MRLLPLLCGRDLALNLPAIGSRHSSPDSQLFHLPSPIFHLRFASAKLRSLPSTHYDTLKVSRDAPIEVIQAAYRSLARKYHPDRHGGSSPEREAQMKAINAAYEVLSDSTKRAEYDRWLAQHLDRRFFRGAPASHSGSRSSRETTHDRRAADIQHTILTIVLSFCYFSTALWMLRNPGLRYLGIIMLLAGLFYFRPSARR